MTNTQELKKKIRSKLAEEGIPDLAFFYKEEVLDVSLELLEELLRESREAFDKKLETPDNKITFNLFETEDILDYFWNYLDHLKSVESGEKIRNIIETFEPKLVEYGSYISYNKRYFDMLELCLKNCELDSDQTRIITEGIKGYKLRGIDLEEKDQKRLKEISKKLSKLHTSFSNNALDSENDFSYKITNFEVIKNLPEEVLSRVNNEKDEYVFTANPADYIAIMKYCDDQNIRKYFHKSFRSFASSGKHDNRSNILKILTLKQEKALILGYKNYAELSLAYKMAGSPEEVIKLLKTVSERAKKKALEEMSYLMKEFNLDMIEDYDIGYYYRRLKQEKYSLDDKELKKYFEFERALKGLFDIVGKIFDLELKQLDIDTELFGEGSDVRFYEVYKGEKCIAYYMLDPFYREGKRSGAWANSLRDKSGKKLPLVINVCNFSKEKDVTLLSMGDVQTLFHEFGHASHKMLGSSIYSDLDGFNVEWDFIEVPSQFLEHWVDERESLTTFAFHYETGESISDHYLETLEILDKLGNGLGTLKQNEYGLLDMMIFSSEVPKDIGDLDEKVLAIVNQNTIFPQGEDYKMYTSFSHIFSGGYSAGYYSYLWAEIIELDLLRECKTGGGMFNKDFLKRYRETILEPGSRKDAKELFYDMMGREVDVEGFYEKKGI